MNIVFDLDGTLIDSAPDLQAAANRMLEGEGKDPLDLATVISFVGNGLPKLVERVMRARGISESQFPRLYDATREFYKAAPADLTRPYPGLVPVLEGFAADGHRLGVCTNKPEDLTRLILARLGLEKIFDVVVGGDALAEKKPHPAPLLQAFEALGDGARLYVGDSEIDAETARRAGVPFALFTEGYRKVPVEDLRHDARFSDFAELPAIVEARAATAPAA